MGTYFTNYRVTISSNIVECRRISSNTVEYRLNIVEDRRRPFEYRRISLNINGFGVGVHRFRVGLGLVWSRSGVGLKSVWDWSGVGLGLVWVRFGVGLGSVWGRFRVSWDRFGVGLGVSLNQFEVSLRSV